MISTGIKSDETLLKNQTFRQLRLLQWKSLICIKTIVLYLYLCTNHI